MLMGKDWAYDWWDHTFGSPFPLTILCADTLAPVSIGTAELKQRVEQVQAGQLGACDVPEIDRPPDT